MVSRKPFISGNWKMYKTVSEAVETAEKLKNLAAGINNVDIMIAPSFTSLFSLYDILKDTNIKLGAQNIYPKDEGAFTGEISPGMLKSCGVSFAIIGHSERRMYFNETDSFINEKIVAAVNAGLTPVLCIGESEEERESDRTFSVLDNQLKIGLEKLTKNFLSNLIIAYEPIWAIGTGKTATKEIAQEVHKFLREKLKSMFDESFSESVRILYGGSVKPGNIEELIKMPDIDGALVGGASLDAESFYNIIKNGNIC